MAAIYTTLFWCALQVTIFLTLAAPIYLIVRRRSPHAATFAAASSLAAVILLSALAASPWPRWSLTADRDRGALANGSLAQNAVGDDQAAALLTEGNTALGGDATPSAASPLAALWEALQFAATPATSTMTSGAPADEPGLHWSAIVVALFVVGTAISGIHLVAGLVAVRRLIAGSRPLEDAPLTAELASLRQRLNIIRPVSLHESSEVATPATVGWRRPAILLPPAWRTWSDVERRSVLAHELAHIAQHDFAAWLIARGAIVVHFYHPLVRWFAGRLQLDQELAADAAAVRLLGDRQQYLHALANLALATPMHRIAGPARTFIPGRSLLVRRVEMLRTNADIRPTTQLSSTLRWAIAPALATLAIIAGGLRPPAAPSVRAAEPETATIEKPDVASVSGYDFSYVPNDFIFLFAIRPSEMAASAQLRPLADFINEASRPQLRAESIDQLTLVLPRGQRDERGAIIPGTGSEYTVFRTNAAVDFQPLLEASYGPTKTEDYNGKQLVTWGDSPVRGRVEFYSPVAGTLVSTPHAGLVRVIDNPESVGSPAGALHWLAEAKGPMFGVVDFQAMKSTFGNGLPQLLMFQPIVDLADYATISIEDGDPLALRVSFACRNPDDAIRVEQTLRAAIVIIKNIVASQRAQLSTASSGAKPAPQSDMRPLFELADQLLASAEVKVTASQVDLTASLKDPAEIIRRALVAPLWAGRQAATRTISMNNLKQLGLAANRYEAMARAFPPAVVYGKSSYGDMNKSGDNATDVPRSWRVELLPLLDQEELYKEYRLDQPWDSEANLAVLKKMPAVFRSPNDEPTSTDASYFALTGPTTMFAGDAGTKVVEVTDGLAVTLLFVEAKRAIPWTKPEDVPYDFDQPVPALGGWRPDEFVAVIADGNVSPFNNAESVDKNSFRPWIGKSDDQVPPMGTPPSTP